ASTEKSKALANTPVQLHIILDQSIIEIFANEGEMAMSEQFFFQSPQFSIETIGQAKIKKGWVLKSIWR
ncbi:MAG: GH32 C-terminal domain-containing protein, partial [Flammeovirgaceae bacterium]